MRYFMTPPRYIQAQTAGTLYGLFLARVHRTPAAEAYRQYDTDTATWNSTTWEEMAQMVARWQAALAGEPLVARGDRVAIMLGNCREWVAFDQAALGLGLVVVPIYSRDRGESAAYILRDAGAKLLLIGGMEQWQALAAVRDRLGPVTRIVSLQRLPSALDPRLRTVDDWLPSAAESPVPDTSSPHTLATIVYTSGTTGPPKGVMLSHTNILSNAENALSTVRLSATNECFLSFLPLSHTFERTVGYYIPMMAGATVAYARSIPQLVDDLRIIRPTVMVAVPRLFERIYHRLRERLARQPLRRWLFDKAVAVGWRHYLYAWGRHRWTAELMWQPLLKCLVAARLRARMGGRLRLVISGSAPLPEPVGRTFIGLGIQLLQGYGLTEYSPVVSVNRLRSNDPASVGPPIPATEVRIGPHDELLVRGPSVMQGYWRQPEATARKIDQAGWLHTGDQARIDNGSIYITGRLKAIIVMANGEKIAPEDVETAITLDPLFEQVMVIGEQQPFLAALVVLDKRHWHAYLREQHQPEREPEPADSRDRERILARIDRALQAFPAYVRIRGVVICTEPWTVANGLLTPSGKCKRDAVLERYRTAVNEIYTQVPAGRTHLNEAAEATS